MAATSPVCRRLQRTCLLCPGQIVPGQWALTVQCPVQVIDGNSMLKVSNGHPMLQRITASGCAVTALIAAFLTLAPNDRHMATAYALGVFGYVPPSKPPCCDLTEPEQPFRLAPCDILARTLRVHHALDRDRYGYGLPTSCGFIRYTLLDGGTNVRADP